MLKPALREFHETRFRIQKSEGRRGCDGGSGSCSPPVRSSFSRDDYFVRKNERSGR